MAAAALPSDSCATSKSLPADAVPSGTPGRSVGRTLLRRLAERLCFTAEGHLDLSWLLVLIFALLGVVGSACEFRIALVGAAAPPGAPTNHVSPWWWAWLGSSQLAVLIAAVPVAKARLLANSRALEAGARAVGMAASAQQMFVPNEWASGVEEGVL